MSKIYLVTSVVEPSGDEGGGECGYEVWGAFTRREDAEKAKDIHAADGDIVEVALDEMPEEVPPMQPGEKVWVVSVYENWAAIAAQRPGRMALAADYTHEVKSGYFKGTCYNCQVVAKTDKQAKRIGEMRRAAWLVSQQSTV